MNVRLANNFIGCCGVYKGSMMYELLIYTLCKGLYEKTYVYFYVWPY